MSSKKHLELRRVMTLFPLIVYGVGDILGAGIYALVGKVAGFSGDSVWISFVVAMVVASLTALTYAELGSRFPKSGGVAHFAHLAFKNNAISFLVGWLMFCTCIASMATLSNAFAGYLTSFVPFLPPSFVMAVLLSGLALVVFRGMQESSMLNMLCTFMEVSGLLVVIGVSLIYLTGSSGMAEEALISAAQNLDGDSVKWAAIFQGASLAFYAFIGFEDLVNVSEEVKNPERNIPLAIGLALGIAGLIYITVSYLALQVLPVEVISQSKAPLLDVVRRAAPQFPVLLFTAFACFAVLNSALLNFVTASRLIYGMSNEKVLPSYFSELHPKRRTPHRAILLVLPIVLFLALSGTLQYLAGTTATLILSLFVVVNLSLIVLKNKKHRLDSDRKHFQIPFIFPFLALATNLVLIRFASAESHRLALILLSVGIGILVLKTISERSKRRS